MTAPRPRCAGCGLPVRRGQPRYTAAEPEHFWHWECKEAARASFEEAARRVPELWVKVTEQLGRLRGLVERK